LQQLTVACAVAEPAPLCAALLQLLPLLSHLSRPVQQWRRPEKACMLWTHRVLEVWSHHRQRQQELHCCSGVQLLLLLLLLLTDCQSVLLLLHEKPPPQQCSSCLHQSYIVQLAQVLALVRTAMC
jgi:hypothetical protein